MSSLPNAALSDGAVSEPWSVSPVLAATLAHMLPVGWRAQKTPKLAVTLGGQPVVPHLLAKGYCPCGAGQIHLQFQGVGEDSGAWGDGGFWPLLLGIGTPASLGCCLPALALGHHSLRGD